MWICLECGKKFHTTKAVQRAANNGCPGCGGVDVDIDIDPTPARRAPVQPASAAKSARKAPAPQPNDGYHGEERDPLRPTTY